MSALQFSWRKHLVSSQINPTMQFSLWPHHPAPDFKGLILIVNSKSYILGIRTWLLFLSRVECLVFRSQVAVHFVKRPILSSDPAMNMLSGCQTTSTETQTDIMYHWESGFISIWIYLQPTSISSSVLWSPLEEKIWGKKKHFQGRLFFFFPPLLRFWTTRLPFISIRSL